MAHTWRTFDSNCLPIAGGARSPTSTPAPREGATAATGRFGKIFKLKERWNDFVKTANQRTVQQVVALCVEHKCGKLVYFQPVGTARERYFLHTAGKVPDRPDNTGWDWGQMQTILAYKCRQQGIELEVRRVGEARVRPGLADD